MSGVNHFTRLLTIAFIASLLGCSSDGLKTSNDALRNLQIDGLTKIDLENIDENSPKEEQLRMAVVDVVSDGMNYNPMMNLSSEVKVNDPVTAYGQLILLQPELKDLITCWGEYKGYYIFSINLKENPGIDCQFLSIYYIPIGGDVFWHFYPNT